MKEKLIMWLVGEMISRLKAEDIKVWIDKGLDMLENKIAETPNKADDMVVLPMIGVLRSALSIPDND